MHKSDKLIIMRSYSQKFSSGKPLDMAKAAKGQSQDNYEQVCDREAKPFHFHAVLYPNQSLSHRGFQIILTIFALYGVIISAIFISMGAWVIPGFYGVEVLFVIWLLFLSFKKRHHYETISLTDKDLIIQDHSPRNQDQSWVFEPSWVKVQLEKPKCESQLHSQLKIISHGKGIIIGEFLSNQEREDISNSLKQALENWKLNLSTQSF